MWSDCSSGRSVLAGALVSGSVRGDGGGVEQPGVSSGVGIGLGEVGHAAALAEAGIGELLGAESVHDLSGDGRWQLGTIRRDGEISVESTIPSLAARQYVMDGIQLVAEVMPDD